MGRFLNADALVSTGQGLLGNNMFAYCNNNPVMYEDFSGFIALLDDLLALSITVLIVIPLLLIVFPPPFILENINQSLSEANNQISILFSKKQPESLDPTGVPNSDSEIKNEDGTIKQKRHYGKDGKAEYDIDYNHSGDNHEFPHVHRWNNGVRDTKWIPLKDFYPCLFE